MVREKFGEFKLCQTNGESWFIDGCGAAFEAAGTSHAAAAAAVGGGGGAGAGACSVRGGVARSGARARSSRRWSVAVWAGRSIGRFEPRSGSITCRSGA